MSRYLERAEHTARLIDVDLQLRLDQSLESSTGRWLRLIEALHVPALLAGEVDANSLAHTLTFNRTNPSSIVSCIASARENLRHVREQSSSEMWEQLNRLYLQMVEVRRETVGILQSHTFFRAVQDGAHLFQGITDSTMAHGEGWHYIQLGRYVERTDALAALIGAHFSRLAEPPNHAVEGAEYLEWVGLLKCCAAFEAYCKVYSAELAPDSSGGISVAEFGISSFDSFLGGKRSWSPDSHRRTHGKKSHTAGAAGGTFAGGAELQPDRRNYGGRNSPLYGEHSRPMCAGSCFDPADLFRLSGRNRSGC